ncbi:hypothetical protein ACFLT1_06255 [Bacteroidota bacterium]
MKKAIFYMIILTTVSLQSNAQKLLNGGLGYFGETGVYPGVVLELEYEQFRSESLSTFSRANVGYYAHPRSHSAVFADIHQGLRRSFSSGIVLESSIGLGVMFSFYNEEVYKLAESGEFEETSRIAKPDLMPSFTLGLGYDFSGDREKRRMAWVRPKMFWQYPYNTLAFPHLSLQIGYTHTF